MARTADNTEVAAKTETLLSSYGGRDVVSTNTAAGATPTVNLANGNVHKLTLTANVTTLTLSGAINGVACTVKIFLTQGGDGSYTVTWPASVKWAAATAPTLSTDVGKIDVVTLQTHDAGTTWYSVCAPLIDVS